MCFLESKLAASPSLPSCSRLNNVSGLLPTVDIDAAVFLRLKGDAVACTVDCFDSLGALVPLESQENGLVSFLGGGADDWAEGGGFLFTGGGPHSTGGREAENP